MTARLVIRSGTLVTPAGMRRAGVECAGSLISGVGDPSFSEGAAEFNAAGLFVSPGLVDIHVHGGGGHSFFSDDPEAVRAYCDWAPRNGVTAFLISTAAGDSARLAQRLESLAPALACEAGAEPLGFHLEGPFINPARKGAFEPATLRLPSREEFARWSAAAPGQIRQVTIAPELPGALDVIHDIAAAGAVPAMGHTDATTAQAREGFAAGVRHVTHLFNAMRPLHQREGGPIAAALLEPGVTCELICDGAHVAPEMLRLAYELLGPRRAVVVTDNLSLAGQRSSTGRFGGETLSVSGVAAVKRDGTLAGSVATMDEHFRNAMSILGVDAATATLLCSSNPAQVAGAGHRKGKIEPGFDADLALFDERWQVVATVCRGRVAFCADSARLSPAR